jgi:hypothetical protein
MRKLAFMLLMMLCFLLGTWQGKAKTNLTKPVVLQIVGDPLLTAITSPGVSIAEVSRAATAF